MTKNYLLLLTDCYSLKEVLQMHVNGRKRKSSKDATGSSCKKKLKARLQPTVGIEITPRDHRRLVRVALMKKSLSK